MGRYRIRERWKGFPYVRYTRCARFAKDAPWVRFDYYRFFLPSSLPGFLFVITARTSKRERKHERLRGTPSRTRASIQIRNARTVRLGIIGFGEIITFKYA